MLTEEQRVRHDLGLPYTGAQPEIFYIRIFREEANGARSALTQRDKYFTNDTRYPFTDEDTFGRIIMVHAVQEIHDAPEKLMANIGRIQKMNQFGRHEGKDDYHEQEWLEPRDIVDIKDILGDPESRRLARLYPGETLARAGTPLPPRSAFAAVNMSSITASVAERFRDAAPDLRPDWSHVLEMSTTFTPKPSA